MPPDCDIEFVIELMPGTAPIIRVPIGWLLQSELS
jgi:hypothetical protein